MLNYRDWFAFKRKKKERKIWVFSTEITGGETPAEDWVEKEDFSLNGNTK